MLRTLLYVSISLALVPACGKKPDQAGGGASADKAEKPTEAPAAKLVYKKLGGLPLEAEVPDDANIEDNSKSAGTAAATIYASPTVFICGAGDMSDVKPTIDESKTSKQKEVNGFKSWTREEKTADGWILEGTGESMIDKKPLYAVSVRRNVGGVAYDCGTNADSKEEVAKVEKLCASLRAAK